MNSSKLESFPFPFSREVLASDLTVFDFFELEPVSRLVDEASRRGRLFGRNSGISLAPW